MNQYTNKDFGYVTLRDALTSRNAEELKDLAKLLAGKRPARKEDSIAAITQLLSGDGLRNLWESLDELSKAAVTEVVHGYDDQFYLSRFLAKYGTAPRRYHHDYRDRTKDIPWTRLDIIFTRDMMPRDIKEGFLAFVPPPKPATVGTVELLPASLPSLLRSWQIAGAKKPLDQPLRVSETESVALHDVTVVLRLIDAGKVGVSATTRRPTLASVKTVAGALRDGDFIDAGKAGRAEDFIRSFAWPLLVQSAGLARSAGAKLELTKAGREALGRPAHEVIRRIWERWLEKGIIDEFNRIEEIKGQNRKGGRGLINVTDRRNSVHAILGTCPPGKWIDIDEFFRYFQATGIGLEVVRDPWSLYITDSQYGSLGYDGYYKWSIVQGRYVMALLWEYAATLGLVDIAHVPSEDARDDYWENWGTDDLGCLSRYDGLKFFRITALGAYCFAIAETYEPCVCPASPALCVLPNHDIVVQDVSAFSSADALFLDRIAVKNGEHTWTLDKMRILDALESGVGAEEIHGFLNATSRSPVPENVQLFINDTIRRASLVCHEGPAELFRTVDEATALLIAHDSAAKSLCYLAGKTRLAVPTRNVRHSAGHCVNWALSHHRKSGASKRPSQSSTKFENSGYLYVAIEFRPGTVES